MCWQEETKIPSSAVSQRSMLHTIDSNAPLNPSTNKFWKVAHIISDMRDWRLQLEPLPSNSIDEQVIRFTARVVTKQFVRNKPNPESWFLSTSVLMEWPMISRYTKARALG